MARICGSDNGILFIFIRENERRKFVSVDRRRRRETPVSISAIKMPSSNVTHFLCRLIYFTVMCNRPFFDVTCTTPGMVCSAKEF